MDELDRIAHDAVDEALAGAGRVADTEQALADVRAGVRMAPVLGIEDRSRHRRTGPLLVAAAAVAVLAVGTAVFTAGNDDARIAPADSSAAPDVSTDVPPSTTTATAPSTSSSTSPVTSPSTTGASETTTGAPEIDSVDLGNGLAATLLPADPERIRTVETFGWRGDLRVSSVAQLWFADGRSIRIRLGTLDTDLYPLRDDTPALGLGGWTLDDLPYEAAAAAGYGVDGDTWFTVEALRSYDVETSTFRGDAFSLDDVRAVLLGLEYDPSADDRTRATTTATFRSFQEFPSCAEEVSVSGTGGRGDLVLFTCDGLLARYDGDTGGRLEVLATFADPTQPAPEEGSVPYVDSIVVSPDGTIWWSVGPEPVSDTLYRFTPGVSTGPEIVGSGIVVSASPDGRWVAAVTAMPSIDLRAVDRSGVIGEGDALAGFDTWGTYVHSPVWSPDSRTLVAEASDRGALAVMDVASGSIRYHAPLDGQVYRSPWFDADGVLHAVVDDGTTQQQAVVGPPGNAGPTSVGPLTVPEIGRVPLSTAASDMFAVLSGGRLEFLDATWATGVIAAAVVPRAA